MSNLAEDRIETKYLVSNTATNRLVCKLLSQLPVHRFTGEGANRLPEPHHFITTVYFDTASHDHLKAAHADPEHNVKIRAREYYDLHPSLTELATSPAQIVHFQPWVWLEVKRRDAGRSTKQRLRLAKHELPNVLCGAHSLWPAGPLRPSCVVNYRRIAFQDAMGALRITVDLDIGFYRPPADLWTCVSGLVRGSFGAPADVERGVLVEVKRSAAAPDWLAQALAAAQAEPVSYSKFSRAGRVVHAIG